MRTRELFLALSLFTLQPIALADDPALAWQWRLEPRNVKAGDEAEIVFSAAIPAGFILYASDFKAELGPRPARVVFDTNDAVEVDGPLAAVNSQRRTDKSFGTEYSYFEQRAEFRQKIRVLKTDAVVSGRIDGQTCQEKDGLCTLIKQSFKLTL